MGRGAGAAGAAEGTAPQQAQPAFSFVDLAPGDGHDGRLEVHEVPPGRGRRRPPSRVVKGVDATFSFDVKGKIEARQPVNRGP